MITTSQDDTRKNIETKSGYTNEKGNFKIMDRIMNKIKQQAKQNKLGIIVGTATACAVVGTLAHDKDIKSISLFIPSDSYQKEYDINTEIPVNITALPYGANINSIEYITSSDSIYFSDSKINTGTAEGRYEIYVVSNDIKSNTLFIDVVDISAREEAEKKADEERLAKEAEEAEEARLAKETEEADKKAEEEQLTKETEETEKKAEEERLAKEAKKEKADEEQAAREAAEEKLLAEQSEKTVSPDVNPSNDSTQESPTAPEEDATAETPPEPEPDTSTPISGIAWLSATGEKYHRINNCGKMNPNKARQISLEDAQKRNYEKCDKCW